MISAGAGDDTVMGFVGADTVDGGAGTDTIVLTATSATLNSATNAQIVKEEAISPATAPAAGTISIRNQAEGFTVTGSGFADTITGGAGTYSITASAGAAT